MIIVGAMAGVFWFLAKSWVADPLNFSSYGIWLGPLISLLVLVACQGLSLLIIKEKIWKLAVILVADLPYLLIFGFQGYYFLAFGFAVALGWSAAGTIRSESEERLKININRIMKRGLPNLVTAILIMVSFAYFLSPMTQATAQKQKLPDYVQTIVEKTIPIFAGDQLQNLPPFEQRSFLKQTTDAVNQQFTNFAKPYFKYMPPILAFGLFLVLQGLSFIMVWLSAVVSIFLFWVLKKSGVIQIRVVQKEAEELEF